MLETTTYYSRHRDARLAYQNARYAVNSVALIAYQREYRSQRKEAEHARRKAWRVANRDAFNASERRRYLATAKEQNARNKAWREANPHKEQARHRAYDLAHPHNVRDRAHRRRALVAGTRLEKIDLKKILRDANGQCGICKQPFDLFGIDFDHIIPLARGGTHTAENIQATHSYCNRVKGAKLV